MTGFFSTSSATDRGVFAPNADFSGLEEPSESHGLNLNNEVWMGGTTVNPTGTHVNVMTLTEGTGIVFTYTPPAGPGFTKGTFKISANGVATTDLHTALYIVSSAGTGMGTGANYTTIADAITAASASGLNSTIFIMPGLTGTYTENLTLPANVNLSAFTCDAQTPNVSIIGKITCTDAGSRSISGLRLTTNSDFFLAVTGSAATIVNLVNCHLNCLNNTGISFTSSNSAARVNASYCTGDVGTTGIGLYTFTSTGQATFQFCRITNSGNSLTASTTSATLVLFRYCSIDLAMSATSTGSFDANYLKINITSLNTTAITTAGTGISTFHLCYLGGGTASAVSIGAGTVARITQSIIDSSNTNAITGAGELDFGGLLTLNTAGPLGINVTTQKAYPYITGLQQVSLPAGDYTVLVSDSIVGATTSAARAITLMSSPIKGQIVTIKDITGSAAANNITITPAAGNIDGAGTKVISSNYGSVSLFYSGTAWFSF